MFNLPAICLALARGKILHQGTEIKACPGPPVFEKRLILLVCPPSSSLGFGRKAQDHHTTLPWGRTPQRFRASVKGNELASKSLENREGPFLIHPVLLFIGHHKVRKYVDRMLRLDGYLNFL